MTIYLSSLAQQKLHIAANKIPNDEISGFGKTVMLDGGGVLITDIIIPPQEVGGAHVEIKNMWQNFFVDAINGRYSEDGSPGDPLDFRTWWHKHPGSTKPSPSSTDTDSLKWLAGECGFGWMAGLIISSRSEAWYGWMNVAPPNAPWMLTHENVDVKSHISLPTPETIALIDEQMKLVTKKTYNTTPHHGGNYNGNRPQQPSVPFTKGGGQDSWRPSGDSSASTSDRPPVTSWESVKAMKTVMTPLPKGGSAHMLEITYKNGNIMVVPDHGQQAEWVRWLASPPAAADPRFLLTDGLTADERRELTTPTSPQGKKAFTLPMPSREPGAKAPKKIKQRIHQIIRRFNIVPIIEVDNADEVVEWCAGVKTNGQKPAYPLGISDNGDVVLGFDDEGDVIYDVQNGDEFWVYYDLNAKAIDRQALDMSVMSIPIGSDEEVAYYRMKYFLPDSMDADEVLEYVMDFSDSVLANTRERDEADDLPTFDDTDVPLTEDESRVEA